MLFSEFIQDTLDWKNNIHWDYYSRPEAYTDNILQPNAAQKFIQNYFEYGRKLLPLLIDPEDVASFLIGVYPEWPQALVYDQRYDLPNERSTHTVSGFFLGLLIENCINGDKPLAVQYPDHYPFEYLWFLTFLYHDYGYSVAERVDPPVEMPSGAPIPAVHNRNSKLLPSSERWALNQMKNTLGITYSPFSSFHRIPKVFEEHRIDLEHRRMGTLNTYPRVRFQSGELVKGHRYPEAVTTRYFNYCINDLKKTDHGIVGGYLFYDRMLKNYFFAFLSAQSEENSPIQWDDFYYQGRHFCRKQLPVFSYIADCILVHNIWKQPENKKDAYKQYRLDENLAETYKIISYEENPLLYILSVADTLEPVKAYEKIDAQLVTDSINIEYQPGERTLLFSSKNTAIDIQVLHQKAKDLEDWTAAKCGELVGGAFELYL